MLIMQDTLAALHVRLDQVRGLFDENVPQSPREKDYRASITSTLESIQQDLLSLSGKLRIDKIVEAKGSRRLEAWAVLQRKFESDDIRDIKERLAGSEALLQSHFEMLSLYVLLLHPLWKEALTSDSFMAYKMRDEFTELKTLIRPILKKLLHDATLTEERQRSLAAESRSIRRFQHVTHAHGANNNTLLERDSEPSYHDAFKIWKGESEDMIKSVVDLPWHQVSNSNYVPSILNESRDGASISPTAQDFIEVNRASLSPTFCLGLPHVAEIPEEPPHQGMTEAALDWCKQQGYPVSGSNFRFDISLETAPGSLKGVSPIHQAIKKGNMPILEQMLSWDCNLEVRLQDGSEDITPFLLACSELNAVAVRLLLDKGVKVDVTDRKGKTGLHLCPRSTSGGRRVAKLLLEDPRAKALDVNAQDQFGMTAAHIAARVGDVKMLEYLLLDENGKKVADANAQQRDGSTPLMVALKSNITNKKQVIDVLLKHSNLTITNNNGQDAKKVAKEYSERDGGYRHLLAQMAQDNTSSRRTSQSTTVFSRTSTQISEDLCSGCKQHCPQLENCKLTIESSVFSQDWKRPLRKFSSSRSSIAMGSSLSIRSAR
ncbi:hypothetical protein IL306_009292 [Fusarium sp. DS 682]|nr:hypothetical protein IL306_009292 [Fusarium sp. DS 682]